MGKPSPSRVHHFIMRIYLARAPPSSVQAYVQKKALLNNLKRAFKILPYFVAAMIPATTAIPKAQLAFLLASSASF